MPSILQSYVSQPAYLQQHAAGRSYCSTDCVEEKTTEHYTRHAEHDQRSPHVAKASRRVRARECLTQRHIRTHPTELLLHAQRWPHGAKFLSLTTRGGGLAHAHHTRVAGRTKESVPAMLTNADHTLHAPRVGHWMASPLIEGWATEQQQGAGAFRNTSSAVDIDAPRGNACDRRVQDVRGHDTLLNPGGLEYHPPRHSAVLSA